MPSNPFLKEIAQILLIPGQYDLRNTCVVFPNKRARLYLSRYMGELTNMPVWAPQYLTISELMEKISGYAIADKLTLLFELFAAHAKITGSDEHFDTFYPYCETLLADFDEIDKYLVEADDLFQNLAGLKTLDGRFNYLSEAQLAHIHRFWKTFTLENITPNQTKFISLWESLPCIYNEFRERLLNRQLAYEGMAYRKAVQELEEEPVSLQHISKFVFIGFNALNACEQRLFRILKNRNIAEFYWDYDSWYTNNEIHEAGFFIRKNLRDFPQSRHIPHDFLRQPKSNVFYVPVSSGSGQTAVLPDILESMGVSESQIENTAIVLADEALLLPALYALPATIKDINVTMGYPVGTSVVYSLIDSLYELLKNARKSTSGPTRWYYKDILALMTNPVLRNRYTDSIKSIRDMAIEKHTTYLSIHDIPGDHTGEIVFNEILQADTGKYLLEVVTFIIRDLPAGKSGEKRTDPVQLELLFQVYTFLTRLQDTLNEQTFKPGQDVLFRLIRKMLKSMHIPFSGEPLAGLQMLGILETRTLDFSNVIILSANEGVLPGSADKPSFIPYNIRAGFELPTPEHHDAMYAYYFYRLIQKADQIALVYDASSAGMKTGERSRFLHQLQYEMQMPVKELHFGSFIGRIAVKPIIIQKSGSAANALNQYSENGRLLSPSSINEYLNCPIKFYFHHIAGLPQPEEATSEVDSRMFGTILHNSLKTIYDTFGTTPVTAGMISGIMKNDHLINDALDKAFSEVLDQNSSPEGYNLIVRQVLYKYIRQFLKAEMRSVPFTILALEKRYETNLILNGKNLRIGGTIDRIDLKDGQIRILDYKTGAVKDRFNSIDSLFDGSVKERNDAAFQVLLYAWVYDRINPQSRIFPGLIFFRQSHEDVFSSSIKMGKDDLRDFSVIKEEFENLIHKGLEEMFDVRLPFLQTENLKVCSYCAYKMICRREEKK